MFRGCVCMGDSLAQGAHLGIGSRSLSRHSPEGAKVQKDAAKFKHLLKKYEAPKVLARVPSAVIGLGLVGC